MNTKRVISLLVCTAMLLAMIPLSLTTVGAADIKGDWTTYRFANEYDDPNAEVDPDEEPTIYKPEAGYTYTDEGFTIVPADYKDTTPAMSVVTKEPQPIKDGIYLQFCIDDYSYDGGTAWYAAGEIAGALIDCTMPFSIYDGDSWEGADDVEYFFVPIDMTDLWEGRINTMRLDLTMSDTENREFDICFAGMFRSVEEGTAYAEQYLKTNNIISEDYTKAPEETKAPDIEAEDTNDGETNPADTNDDTNASTDKPTTDDPAKEGCGSVIGMSAAAVLAAASAFVALKKKD